MKLEDLVTAIADDLCEYTPAQKTREALHNWMGREPAPAQPKPGAGAFERAVEIACHVYSGRSENWSREFVAQMRSVITAITPIICAGKDSDTTTVIRDNDAKMEEIERLKRSLELYRADIHLMREREETWVAERTAMRWEIGTIRHPDIDAAAWRGSEEFKRPGSTWISVVRAVYGLKSEGKEFDKSHAPQNNGSELNDSLRQQVAALSATLKTYITNLEHWRQEASKLNAKVSTRDDEIAKLKAKRFVVTDEMADAARIAYFNSFTKFSESLIAEMNTGRECWRCVVRAVIGAIEKDGEPESLDELA